MISAVLLLALLLGGCLPYAVGTTARPVRRGAFVPSSSVSYVPGGVERLAREDSLRGQAHSTGDLEARLGLDDASDLGVRLLGVSGAVLSYKRRLSEATDRGAVAALVGGGLVNRLGHAYLEAALLASGSERGVLTPYGGLRAMQLLPLAAGGTSGPPVTGGFAGLRLGRAELGVSLETGIYSDRAAAGRRGFEPVVVPSLTLHGTRWLRLPGALWR